MASGTTNLAVIVTVCLFVGCQTGRPVRDPAFAQALTASPHVPSSAASPAVPFASSPGVPSTDQTSWPAAAWTDPVVPELVGPQPVETYIHFALSHHPTIHAARSRADAAAMRVPQAASLKDPMVDVVGWPIYPHTPQTASGRMTVDLMVSQEVPWFGKRATQGAAAQEGVHAARAELVAAELKTVEAVRLAYYDLFFVQQSIRITEQDRQLLADMVGTADSLYRTGKVNQPDLLRLQAELSAVDGELIRLRQMLAAAQAELAEALYLTPDTPLAALPDLPAESLPDDLQRLYEQAIVARPELHAMLAEIERDRRMVELAQLGYRPDVTFQFGWGEMTTNRALAPTADGIDNLTAGMSLNLPVYRQRLDAAVREAEAQVVARSRQYDQMRSETQRQVKKLFTEAISQRDLSQLFRESILPKTEQAFQISLREYQVGRAEFADLLENWRELLRFHLTLLQQETQLRKSLASLERVLGGPAGAVQEPIAAPQAVPPATP